MKYYQVYFRTPLAGGFTYAYEGEEDILFRRVRVMLGRRLELGYVIEEIPTRNFPFTIKKISQVLDDFPLAFPWQIDVARKIAAHNISSPGEAYSLFMPFGKEVAGFPRKIPDSSAPSKETEPEKLSPAQQEACETFLTHSARKACTFLLHGVTGSGKTVVYAALIEKYLSQGKQCVLLVPEIGLTPQLQNYFQQRFAGEKIAIIHSRISSKLKYWYWHCIYTGKIRLIIGARSVMFAPFADLGLVIIDEEHEGTYKNNASPRYHARQVASMVCRSRGVSLLLGSATPSVEVYARVREGVLPMFYLDNRFHDAPLPETKIVRREPRDRGLLATRSLDELAGVLGRGEQAIVYLNQRGYGSSVTCLFCGFCARCPRCSISLRYHKRSARLSCHYCGFAMPFPEQCPDCGREGLEIGGAGTEKLEEELIERFPQTGILRFDTDSIRTEKQLIKSLNEFRDRKYGIMLGTQMVTKGHDFPGVSAVFIVSPERSLAFPDFRSAERTFSQVTQVAGRAGRRKIQGRVFVQTAAHEHYAVRCALQQDYHSFFSEEIKRRELFGYPPVKRIMRLVVRGLKEETVQRTAEHILSILSPPLENSVEILGPAPCLFERMADYYRWNIIFKISRPGSFLQILCQFRDKYTVPAGIYVEYDMDPAELL